MYICVNGVGRVCVGAGLLVFMVCIWWMGLFYKYRNINGVDKNFIFFCSILIVSSKISISHLILFIMQKF